MQGSEDLSVIQVFFEDASHKSFLVTSAQTSNAVKYMVLKRLNLPQSEWGNYDLCVLINDKKIRPLTELHPLPLHLSWGVESGKKYKFLFITTKNPRPNELTVSVDTYLKVHPSDRTPKSDKKRASLNRPLIKTKNSFRSPRVHFDEKKQKPDIPSSLSAPQIVPLEDTETEIDLPNFNPETTRISLILSSIGFNPSDPPSLSSNQQLLLKWISCKLSKPKKRTLPALPHPTNLSSDLRDGTILCLLLEQFTSTPLKFHLTPQTVGDKLENLAIVLSVLREVCNIKIKGISAEDLYGSSNEEFMTLILMALAKRYGKKKSAKTKIDFTASESTPEVAPVVEASPSKVELEEEEVDTRANDLEILEKLFIPDIINLDEQEEEENGHFPAGSSPNIDDLFNEFDAHLKGLIEHNFNEEIKEFKAVEPVEEVQTVDHQSVPEKAPPNYQEMLNNPIMPTAIIAHILLENLVYHYKAPTRPKQPLPHVEVSVTVGSTSGVSSNDASPVMLEKKGEKLKRISWELKKNLEKSPEVAVDRKAFLGRTRLKHSKTLSDATPSISSTTRTSKKKKNIKIEIDLSINLTGVEEEDVTDLTQQFGDVQKLFKMIEADLN